MNEKILIVDDEKEIADLLEVYLQNDHYEVYKVYNGRDALRCMEKTEIDLAILDVMLPDIDGFRICQKIREKFFLSGNYAHCQNRGQRQDHGSDHWSG